MPSVADRPESGSTLLLVPSAMLLLFLLTVLVVDSASTFLAQRQLADVCSGAANDAATAALDPAVLFGVGTLPMAVDPMAVDPNLALAVARTRSAPLAAQWGHPVDAVVATEGPVIRLQLQASAPLPIGARGRREVAITATCRSTSQRR